MMAEPARRLRLSQERGFQDRFRSRTHKHGKTNWDAVIRVYDEAGDVIDTHERAADFKE